MMLDTRPTRIDNGWLKMDNDDCNDDYIMAASGGSWWLMVVNYNGYSG